MSDAGHRRPETGLGDGLRRGQKIAIVGGEWRFGKPPPDAQATPPEAHEALVSRETVAEVPLTGPSFGQSGACATRGWVQRDQVAAWLDSGIGAAPSLRFFRVRWRKKNLRLVPIDGIPT